jgi:hypothetical protein
MPYIIRKVRNQDCYQLKNKISGKIHSKCTTKDKANKQLRLLNAIEYGHWKPNKKKSRSISKSRKIKK